ncbi:DNA-binding transcriptional regulator, MerR family [Geodermatophilus telluris]|uniref:DNA-binding transcriptional regulator, MerR family n=1 Tax=Geodermatophilus telluris TaxID=1190417 RepID=A0A1G6Q751_9ACTN|nr:MerR family transcriptional regulator [Geodermatophilus telluris]SDC88158.1 DNA-binding transcriptional regulator, MerR family [Geodermatophilus telluris]
MVSIGALARLAGTTTRAIRHYHEVGLLPEPRRRPNGYRDYDLRDAVRLLRVRRLADLGLSLPEVTAALRDDPAAEVPAAVDGTALRASLSALDAELARQEESIRARRRELAALLAGDTDPSRPAEVAGLLEGLALAAPGAPDRALERDGELLEVLAAADPDRFGVVATAYRAIVDDPAAVTAMTAWAGRFEALATARPDDPAVAALATELAAAGREWFPGVADGPDGTTDATAWNAFLAGLAPAQRRCVELAGREWSTCAR